MRHADDDLEKDRDRRQADHSKNDAPSRGDVALRLLALEERATAPARPNAKKSKDGPKNGKRNRNRDRQQSGHKSELRKPVGTSGTLRRRGAHVLEPRPRVGMAVVSMPGRPSCSTRGAATVLPFGNRSGAGDDVR